MLKSTVKVQSNYGGGLNAQSLIILEIRISATSV